MFCSKMKLKEIEMKKKIILEEAKKIIHKVGFKNAKMTDIANKVGFSKGSLYSYFQDKEEIAMNIFKEHLEKMFDKLKDLPDQDIDALEKFEKIKKVHLGFIKEGKHLILIKPDLKDMKKIHIEVFELKYKLFDIIKRIIEQGQDEKTFKQDLDINELMIILDSLMAGILFNASMLKNVKNERIKSFDVEEMIKKSLDFFIMAITNSNLEISK